jgi:hypothetical protein
VSCVLGFSDMMYIDLNHHDSDMSNHLSCGNQHIINLLELMEGRFKFELL